MYGVTHRSLATIVARLARGWEYHLGSVEAVPEEAGEELAVLCHDPYGERCGPDLEARLTPVEVEALRVDAGPSADSASPTAWDSLF